MTEPFASVRGDCWRAVTTGAEAHVLDGTTHSGRYNRPGERALYMSGSPAGVGAAMARYGEAPRTLVRLRVNAESLIDVRDESMFAAFDIDPSRVTEDWLAALNRGEEPASWAVSDRARQVGAAGLIDRSRHAPDEWHLVLFRWNEGSGPAVSLCGYAATE